MKMSLGCLSTTGNLRIEKFGLKWNTLSISLNFASWSMQPEGNFVLAFWHPSLHQGTNLSNRALVQLHRDPTP